MKSITIASIALLCVSLALNATADRWPLQQWIALACAVAAVVLAWRGLVQP